MTSELHRLHATADVWWWAEPMCRYKDHNPAKVQGKAFAPQYTLDCWNGTNWLNLLQTGTILQPTSNKPSSSMSRNGACPPRLSAVNMLAGQPKGLSLASSIRLRHTHTMLEKSSKHFSKPQVRMTVLVILVFEHESMPH